MAQSQVTKLLWNSQRFGVSPRKLWARAFNATEPRIVCISIPKAGTHLVERALCLHPRLYRTLAPTIVEANVKRLGGERALLQRLRSGQILMAHWGFTKERDDAIKTNDVKCIFVVRDPRDIVISRAFYMARTKTHRAYRAFSALSDTKSQIKMAIEGCPDPQARVPSIGYTLESYSGWLRSGCLTIRFEDMIGASGGGSQSTQMQLLAELYDYIELDVSQDDVQRLGMRLFSSASPTFRKGSIGQWRQHFDAELVHLFKKVAGAWLIHYGYERDDNW